MNTYSVFKHLAFRLDPEFTHDSTLKIANTSPWLASFFNATKPNEKLELKTPVLTFPFPVGVAAGFDKNAIAIPFFEKLGFGALEVGTVTKKPQIGNPKPRISRHPSINSLQNAMGFPNSGADKIFKNMTENLPKKMKLGTNIGKNKDTSELETPNDYLYLYKKFAPISDYMAINISSPNTPGLRSFQKKDKLKPIVEAISSGQKESKKKPTFLKIAPDLEESEIRMICELAKEFSLDGIIATNTTIQHNFGAGGVSGDYIKPYSQKARKIACDVLREDPTQTVIGVGGISSYNEIKQFWKQGGLFTQIYTSFIYHGPNLLKEIEKSILGDLSRLGLENLDQLIEFYRNEK